MSDRGFPAPKPAVDDERKSAYEVEKEIGDSEPWDEDSVEVWDDSDKESRTDD